MLTAQNILNTHWREEGFSVPNNATYPWMWLWDSAFHVIVRATQGDARALTELESIFFWQTPSGFVPHMGYQTEPAAAYPEWKQEGHSPLTQPPMYAHAALVADRNGFDVKDSLLTKIERGLDAIWEQRMTSNGLLFIVHPWESGCDDSPRWDAWNDKPYSRENFRTIKWNLVSQLRKNKEHVAVDSKRFKVCSVSFNALVAFNYLEFAELTGSTFASQRGQWLIEALDSQWSSEYETWCDVVELGPTTGAAAPTLDALLPMLCTQRRDAFDVCVRNLNRQDRFLADFGLRGVSKHFPLYDPLTYWRGPSWPHLNYLFAVGYSRRNEFALANDLQRRNATGAGISNFAEYWHPDTGQGLGAQPQSWTTVAGVSIEQIT